MTYWRIVKWSLYPLLLTGAVAHVYSVLIQDLFEGIEAREGEASR